MAKLKLTIDSSVLCSLSPSPPPSEPKPTAAAPVRQRQALAPTGHYFKLELQPFSLESPLTKTTELAGTRRTAPPVCKTRDNSGMEAPTTKDYEEKIKRDFGQTKLTCQRQRLSKECVTPTLAAKGEFTDKSILVIVQIIFIPSNPMM